MLREDIREVLEQEVLNYDLKKHTYFKSLTDGSMNKEVFLQTQEQFTYMVEYFSRPMSLLISNIEDELTRMKIVENLWEEHGNGDPEKIHARTIFEFINNMRGGEIQIYVKCQMQT